MTDVLLVAAVVIGAVAAVVGVVMIFLRDQHAQRTPYDPDEVP